MVTLVFGQFSIETYKCEYAGLSIVASTARSQQTSRVGSPWTAQLRTNFSPIRKKEVHETGAGWNSAILS